MPTDSTCCDETTTDEVVIDNLPQLSAIEYRVGRWSTIYDRLLSRLTSQEIEDGDNEGERPLAALTTRTEDDPTMALCDAFACMGDILTFYQERIANEGYLRTATERYSILQLTSALGYSFSPAVSASAWLAFTLDDHDSAADSVTIPAGTKVKSTPSSDDELPQTFETSEALVAYKDWNAIEVRQTVSIDLDALAITESPETDELYFSGVGLNLSPGDMLLFVAGNIQEPYTDVDHHHMAKIIEVEEDATLSQTWVRLGRPMFFFPPNGVNSPLPVDITAYVFRSVMYAFGHNAPEWDGMPAAFKAEYAASPQNESDWPGFETFWRLPWSSEPNTWRGRLSGDNKAIVPGSWLKFVVFQGEQGGSPPPPPYISGGLFLVERVWRTNYTNFTITSKVTDVEIIGPSIRGINDPFSIWDRRRWLTIYTQSEELTVGGTPITDNVSGTTIQLSSAITGLEVGQIVAVRGDLADGSGEASELATIASIDTSTDADQVTVLTLASALSNTYSRSGCTVNANVVAATHGETTDEVLGSGDASSKHQTFTLSHTPLSYVSSSDADGMDSTLSLSVSGITWTEVESFYEQEPGARVFTVRHDEDGVATLRFGDGRSGARLPTGLENVIAAYRKGAGVDGNVAIDTLNLLQTRPVGVRSVTNPAAASGGQDAEEIEDIRENAPRTVLDMERLVSLQDYEDFANNFAGVAKAHATSLLYQRRRAVFVTILGEDGAELDATSAVLTSLEEALGDYGLPELRVFVGSKVPIVFNVDGSVLVEDEYDTDDVMEAVLDALEEAFSFDARDFTQAVTTAEIIEVMHSVEGVKAVDLDGMYLTGTSPSPPPSPSYESILIAEEADIVIVSGVATLVAADILVIGTANLTEMEDE
ncbi:MAG: putative baseplate assembly protein [Alphaproteobacteria bacterium]|nr:putative baseplate assembly protein [Alphaproteobacteria bacterium]